MSINAVSAASRPGGRFVERQHGGTYGKRARDLDQPLVDVRECPGGHVDRAAIADEGEQAFGDGGARGIVLRGKERGGAEPSQRSAISTLSMTDRLSNSRLV